jgi:hypothetical protein
VQLTPQHQERLAIDDQLRRFSPYFEVRQRLAPPIRGDNPPDQKEQDGKSVQHVSAAKWNC